MINVPESSIYKFDAFCVDSGKRLLLRDDETIALTPKVFETLLYLVNHNGKVLEKDELMSAIWPDTIVEENNLNKNISVLRQVLGENPGAHRFIVTVPGKGYKFVADVRTISVEKIPETSDSKPRRERRSSKRSAFAAAGVIAAIAIAVLAFGYSYFNNQRQIDSIAVMPFVNESGNPELEYLSDGMTERLIARLSKLPNLQVRARSSAFRYKGSTDTKKIGHELNVQAVLYGRVVQRGDELLLDVELVDSQTENRLWEQTYNRRSSNLITLQEELARDLVRRLRLKLSGEDEQKLVKTYTDNVEAHELFLRGQFHFRRLTNSEINKGIGYLEQAIELDPSYALAYTGLSDAYRGLGLAGEMYPGDVFPKAKAASLKAVEIDDHLAEAHGSLASSTFFYDWNWQEAETQFKRAIELDPNSPMSRRTYGDCLFRLGREEEAIAQITRARELEPLSPFMNAFEAWFTARKDADAALARVQIAIDLDPNFYFAHMIAGHIYREKKMYEESISEYRLARSLSPYQTWSDIGFADTLVESGRIDEARALLNEMLQRSKSRWIPPFNIAAVYSLLGEKDQAFSWLEKGYEQRDPRMAFMKTDSRLENLHGDPRFQDLLRRVGF